MSKQWPNVPLHQVLSQVERPEHVDPERAYRLLGVRWYANGLFIKETCPGSSIQAAKVYKVQAGDFVYNRLFAWKGSFAIAQPEHDGCYVSNEFPCFETNSERLDTRYLQHYFSIEASWLEALGLSSGGTPTSRNRLKEDKFLAMALPLPPLPEQRRIVARIEEVAGRIAEAKDLAAPAGREVAALYPAELGARFAALAEVKPVTRLGDLTTCITDGPHQTPVYVPEGVPFVTVRNMVSGKLNFDGIQFITEDDHFIISRRCKPQKGDVLYSKDGATRGHPCLIDTDREFNIFVSVALIKPVREQLDGAYLCHLLNSNWIRDRMFDRSRGDMIPHIVLREIRDFPIPLPSLLEQREIVAEIDKFHERTQELVLRHGEVTSELHSLLPSILDKAFRGEL